MWLMSLSVCSVHQGCPAQQSRWPKKIQVVRTGPSFHLLPKSAYSFPSCCNALTARFCPTDLHVIFQLIHNCTSLLIKRRESAFFWGFRQLTSQPAKSALLLCSHETNSECALCGWATGMLQGCHCLCRRLCIPRQEKASKRDVPAVSRLHSLFCKAECWHRWD